jgi:ferredoxin
VRVDVDWGLCESNGVCAGVVPEVFHLDDADQLHVLRAEVSPEMQADVFEAVRQCPRQAISLVE